MNPLAFLNPYRWLIYGGLVLAVVFGGAVLKHRYDEEQRDIGRAEVQAKWDTAKAATAKVVEDQRARNIELQRAAEKKYVVTQKAQDHYFTKTITEIRYAAAPLASCPVPPELVRLLNNSAKCASGDSPASCGTDGKVPGP